MTWHQADLLSWTDISRISHLGPFDVIVDKSTSDAIATSPDHYVPSPAETDCDNTSPLLCPVIRETLSTTGGAIKVSPVELLALHLVPITRRGSTWIVLSYSSVRFDNRRLMDRYWSLRCRIPMKAPSGNVSSTAYTPEVFHWLYVLERR